MSEEREKQEAKPNWKVEEFYFGNPVWPSHAIYRSDGERLQIRMEMYLPLTQINSESKTYRTDPNYKDRENNESIDDFLARHQDCEFHVHDGYIATNGGGQYVPPSLFLIGWKEIIGVDGQQQYEDDKKTFIEIWGEPAYDRMVSKQIPQPSS